MKRTMMLLGVLVLLVSVRAAPANAFGLGLFGDFSGGKMIWDGKGAGFLTYGGGFVLDTNLASDVLFNYRLELGFGNLHSSYTAEETDYATQLYLQQRTGTYIPVYRTVTKWENSLLLSTVHYFGFGVLRTQYVRLWLGPQISFGGMLTNLTGVYLGMGFAVGLNVNIGKVFTISMTGSGRFLGAGRFYTEIGKSKTSGGYGGDGRVTVAFMFRVGGDSYK